MSERFAPSPTGLLHLGHAFSALTAWEHAKESGRPFLLRIEDIDTTRSRPQFEEAIYRDLRWLGLDWPQPVLRQSERMATYKTTLDQLITLGVCYPCSCTRKDITSALRAPQEDTGHGGESLAEVYPGTCNARAMSEQRPTDAVRLDMARAIDWVGGSLGISRLGFEETGPTKTGWHALDADKLLNTHGDIVLARRDIGTSYHIAVVSDDASQEIGHVTRGRDMFEATEIHVLLQTLLRLGTPQYHHHRLIRDDAGNRLAKRDDARAIQKYRNDGATPADIRRLVGL